MRIRSNLFVLRNFITDVQGGPKKVSHHHFFQKIALKIANEIRFLHTVKV